MSETEALLARITALRQRLEKSRGLPRQSADGSTFCWLTGEKESEEAPSLRVVEQHVQAEGEHDLLVDRTVQPATGPIDPTPPPVRQLTARARRVLEEARGLLVQLRSLTDAFAPPYPDPVEAGTLASEYLYEFGDPLAHFYRETAAIADTALRMVPHFPDTATGQLHLCEGLEGILKVVAQRLRTLSAAVEMHRRQIGLQGELAQLLSGVATGEIKDLQPFRELADRISEEIQEGEPLRFLAGDPTQPAHFVAGQSLTTARIAARIARFSTDLKGRLQDVVVAALLHDVGMLRVPIEILSHPGLLSNEQRRVVEGHCQTGASLLEPLVGKQHWLIEVAASHHERLDGTGYPGGLRGQQIGTLARLLAVCDCYGSLCSPRPHRPARETRTALADTLLLADQGQLDGQHCEHLMQLSFYPVGSAVELADGTVGVVVAVPGLKRDLNMTARPVVALLLDGDKQPLPLPRYLDLAHADRHSIVRTLSTQERSELFGPRFPEWVSA